MFDYSEEFQKMTSSLSGGARMIIIRGRRRTGKTSLLLSSLNGLGRPYVVLDGRAFSSSPQVRREEFVKLLEDGLNEFLRRERRLGAKVIDALKHVQGLERTSGAIPGLSLRWGPLPRDAVSVSSIFDALSDEAARQKTSFIIAIDEAQEFRKVMRYDLTSVLAHAYDYCPGLKFVVTGSEAGLLHKFLRVDDPEAPLFGRAMVEIELSGLTKERSVEYLREGFRQVGMEVPGDVLEGAHLRFDGIIGWLTYLGFRAREERELDQKVIEETASLASKMAASEFRNFLGLYRSERYRTVMKSLAGGSLSWADLKRAIESKEGMRVGQGEVTKVLHNLEDAGFVAKDEGGAYSISEPMTKEAASKGII